MKGAACLSKSTLADGSQMRPLVNPCVTRLREASVGLLRPLEGITASRLTVPASWTRRGADENVGQLGQQHGQLPTLCPVSGATQDLYTQAIPHASEADGNKQDVPQYQSTSEPIDPIPARPQAPRHLQEIRKICSSRNACNSSRLIWRPRASSRPRQPLNNLISETKSICLWGTKDNNTSYSSDMIYESLPRCLGEFTLSRRPMAFLRFGE